MIIKRKPAFKSPLDPDPHSIGGSGSIIPEPNLRVRSLQKDQQ
jgi:hypothetical protein